MLNLEGLRVEGVKETDDEYTITVTVTDAGRINSCQCYFVLK